MLPEYRINAGFLPLTDSLLLVTAAEKGFAKAEGVELALIRETSWANIRDRIAVGHFDVAHMLAPMPIAASLDLTPISVPMLAPIALGLGGNAVTVGNALWRKMTAAGAPEDFSAGPVGYALARVVATGGPKLRFGVVHPHSSHNYELRYWLAASGVDPRHDVEIVVLPPPLMPDALKTGVLDGYCVGEPWNSAGVASGAGRIATVKAAIWKSSPEKVLGTTETWAVYNGEAMSALLRAIYKASQWCADPANHPEAAALMSEPRFLGLPVEVIAAALSGRIQVGRGITVDVADFFVPHEHDATFPWSSHALWFYSQMVRWGDVTHSEDHARLAAASYRPDLYRKALAPLGVIVPANDFRRIEGSDFFDGRPFDPSLLDSYINN
jgi:NitT/TauT family transport system ATP-binding protein